MTLSVVLEGRLWGIISFHHQRARLAPHRVRQLLDGFLPVFCLKLGLMRQAAALELSWEAADGGQAVVMATHDPAAAARADRVLFVNDGTIGGELVGASAETIAACGVEMERS